jgi:Domain of unknown function (DUF6484)
MKSEQIVVGLDFATLEAAFDAGQSETPLCHPGETDVEVPGLFTPCTSSGVLVGTLVGLDAKGMPLVAGSRPGDPLSARSLVPLSQAELGREVVLSFEGGDPEKPIVLGLLQPLQTSQTDQAKPTPEAAPCPIEVKLDGERLVFTANKEIVLRCGEASITLTRAGKVLIRGAHIVSRSSGMNRIQGGVVHIN